jgi:hypothetical protein
VMGARRPVDKNRRNHSLSSGAIMFDSPICRCIISRRILLE